VKVTPFGGEDATPADIETARIVVLPLCYENAVSYGTGTGKAPLHILEASEQLECLDEEILVDWCQMAIHTLPPLIPSAVPKEAVAQMQAAAAKAAGKGRFLLTLGGDHAVSLGPIAAVRQIHPDMGVLQIDAHLDLRDTWNGSRHNHACVMRRVIDDYHLPTAQVGIRSFSPEEYAYVRQQGLQPFMAHKIRPADDRWISQVLEQLPQKIYITIDVDGLDPANIPGTGTPEPGGLSYRQVTRLIQAAGQHKQVLAADIVELVKIDGSQVSEFTAAKIATKLMVYCCHDQNR
jgi:agmatinase